MSTSGIDLRYRGSSSGALCRPRGVGAGQGEADRGDLLRPAFLGPEPVWPGWIPHLGGRHPPGRIGAARVGKWWIPAGAAGHQPANLIGRGTGNSGLTADEIMNMTRGPFDDIDPD